MNLLIIFSFLIDTPTMPVPSLIHYYILLLIQVRISLFWNMFFQEISWNIINIRRGPAQDVHFDIILWYTAKTIPTLLE